MTSTWHGGTQTWEEYTAERTKTCSGAIATSWLGRRGGRARAFEAGSWFHGGAQLLLQPQRGRRSFPFLGWSVVRPAVETTEGLMQRKSAGQTLS